MRQSRPRVGLTLILLVVAVGLLASPASADINITHDDSYDGQEGEDEQAIKLNMTIEPQVVTENLEVTVDDAPGTLLDPESPNSPNPGVEQVADDEFFVEEIEPGQTASITFEVYPKSIREAEQDVAFVRWQSDQVPSTQTESLEADLSNSPLIELESARERNSDLREENADLESEIESIENWRWYGIALSIMGVVIAAIGVVTAVVWGRRQTDSAYGEAISELDDLKREFETNSTGYNRVENKKKELEEEWDQ